MFKAAGFKVRVTDFPEQHLFSQRSADTSQSQLRRHIIQSVKEVKEKILYAEEGLPCKASNTRSRLSRKEVWCAGGSA